MHVWYFVLMEPTTFHQPYGNMTTMFRLIFLINSINMKNTALILTPHTQTKTTLLTFTACSPWVQDYQPYPVITQHHTSKERNLALAKEKKEKVVKCRVPGTPLQLKGLGLQDLSLHKFDPKQVLRYGFPITEVQVPTIKKMKEL